jgi:hypothetical protein
MKQRPIIVPRQRPIQPTAQNRLLQHPLVDLREHDRTDQDLPSRVFAPLAP